MQKVLVQAMGTGNKSPRCGEILKIAILLLSAFALFLFYAHTALAAEIETPPDSDTVGEPEAVEPPEDSGDGSGDTGGSDNADESQSVDSADSEAVAATPPPIFFFTAPSGTADISGVDGELSGDGATEIILHTESADYSEQFAAIMDELSSISGQLSPLAEQLTLISEQTSPLSEELPLLSEQTSAISEQLLMVTEQTDTIAEQLSVVAEQTAPLAEQLSSMVEMLTYVSGILIFFVVVILCKFAYSFFNIFF